ncbi:MAG: fasciclin domain-containing protein [Chloroflexota bacterium]
MNKIRFSLVAFGLLMVLSATSVFSAPVQQSQTIAEIAAGDDSFDTLVTALSAAGLVDTLNGDGPFTVFAPTDAAFAKLPPGTVSSLLADPNGALTQVLLYHVVSGDISSFEAIASTGDVTTVQGEPIRTSTVDGRLFLNASTQDAEVVSADIVASNGVIHVIDEVILPPSIAGEPADTTTSTSTTSTSTDTSGSSIAAIAAGDDRFDTLVTALSAAGLVDTLSGGGPFTVFAPTDAAFAKLPAGTVSSLLADPSGALTQVLLYHVVSGDITSFEAISSTGDVTTVQGEAIRTSSVDGKLFLNASTQDAEVIIPDLTASNGVIHVIDEVILPPSIAGSAATTSSTGSATSGDTSGTTIAGIAAGDDRFDTLVTALSAAGLVDTLNGSGPFTVFAPTDDAFAKLPAGTVSSLLADPSGALTQVLLYHVVSGDISSFEAIASTGDVTTVQGEAIRTSTVDGKLYLNNSTQDAEVIIGDIVASNGVIHVIDEVILPPSIAGEPAATSSSSSTTTSSDSSGSTIAAIAAGDGRFDTLVTALSAAGLVDTLNGDGPFTVFAPTDDAFAALPAGTVSSLLADPSGALTTVLLYHVVSGDISSAEAIGSTGDVTTVQGEPIRTSTVDGNLYLNAATQDAQVIIADIVASNGVIHVIDKVILPPSIAPAPE